MEDILLNEINTLENRVFRLQCEIQDWRAFRDLVKEVMTMQSTFGTISETETAKLNERLESIKYL